MKGKMITEVKQHFLVSLWMGDHKIFFYEVKQHFLVSLWMGDHEIFFCFDISYLIEDTLL